MPSPRAAAPLLPALAVGASLLSQNFGAALAKSLFPLVGAMGVTGLRVGLAALLLMGIWRPWRTPPGRAALPALIAYGLLLGVMNILIFQAFARIPIGVAVAIESLGPLAVVLAASRRPRDLLWLGLTVIGLILLAPLDQVSARLDPFGVAFALGAALCWALYILVGRSVAAQLGAGATAWGMAIAALLAVPIGLSQATGPFLSPHILLFAMAVAALSSALPYSLEMAALRRLPAQVFGILVSAAPAVAALAGLMILGERLSLLQALAIACVVIASAGSALGSRAAAPGDLP